MIHCDSNAFHGHENPGAGRASDPTHRAQTQLGCTKLIPFETDDLAILLDSRRETLTRLELNFAFRPPFG